MKMPTYLFIYSSLTFKGWTLDICTINPESSGWMLDISNAQHVMSGWLLTHCPCVWNPNKPMQVDVEGSFVSSEQRNRLSGFWFRNYLCLDRTVHDRSAKYSPFCLEKSAYSSAIADQCYQSFQGSVRYSQIVLQ
jgi:hypothetical protein